jgi:hypothetical protein
MKLDMGWMYAVVYPAIAEYKSIAEYPNIQPGMDFNGYATSK